MTSLKDLKLQLREFPCHFIWNLEDKSIKQFDSLMDLINEHIAESPAMVVEGLLFKSYLFFSDFKGNVEKKKPEAIECINEVRTLLIQNTKEASVKDGYLAIALALESWLERDKTKLETKIKQLQELTSKYEVGSCDHNKFQGSIHATKGFALSRIGMLRYSESVLQFQKAVQMCPNEKDWMFSLGLILWRIGKASVNNRNRLCDDLKKAESIFYDVLKMDPVHSYAMVLIAEIKRRKGNYNKANYFLESAQRPKPTRKKIFGEVASVYRKMKKYPEALRLLQIAEKMTEPGSFIYHQLYLVYRDMSTPPPIDYLQKAIDANPSNFAAKFDRAKEFISEKKYDDAHEYFDYILNNIENDPQSEIRTNYQFALFLESRNKYDEAIDKYQILIDNALEECKENDNPPFTFSREIDWMVAKSIKKLKHLFENRLKADTNDKNTYLHLAELEKKLGYTRSACWHYEKALKQQPSFDAELKWTILKDLAVMKTSLGFLQDVDAIIEDMEQLGISSPEPNIRDKCKADLAVKKGEIALHGGKTDEALKLFVEAIGYGNLTGARLLFGEVKNMNRTNKDFYTYCAQIDVCIERSHDDNRKQLKEDLDVLGLLSSDTSNVGVVLSDLRKTQFNMERNIILQDNIQQLALEVDVIHKCRTILTQTMTTFRNCQYGQVQVSCDYFNIPECSSAKLAKQVKDRLQKKYKWTQFGRMFPDLFKFLVSIQPASNPKENNWMFALLRMDNSNKHEHSLGDKLKVKVYTDQQGTMVEQEFTTLEVAREACEKIKNILDEFHKYL